MGWARFALTFIVNECDLRIPVKLISDSGFS